MCLYEYVAFVFVHCLIVALFSRFERDPATYGFKTGPRDKYDVLNFGKKDKVRNLYLLSSTFSSRNDLTCTTDSMKYDL